MSKTVITNTICKCDLCGAECNENDKKFKVDIFYCFGDVGSNYIYATFYAHIPYGTTAGYICRKCLLEGIKKYIRENCKD